MTGQIQYIFSEKVWRHSAVGGWFFVSLPETISVEIRANLKNEEEGWGRLKATAEIGTIQWKTAIWFDTKMKRYLLPLKTEVRTKENIQEGNVVTVRVLL